MIFTFALIILYIIVYNRSKRVNFLSYFFLLNFFVDLLIGFVGDGNFFGATRHLLNFLLVCIWIFKSKKLDRDSVSYNIFFYLYIAYLGLLIPFSSSDLFSTISSVLPVINTFLLYPLGVLCLRDRLQFANLVKSTSLVLIIFPFYVLISAYLKLGNSYSDEFSIGYLSTSRIYIVSIALVLFPLSLKYLTNISLVKRSFFIAMGAITATLLVINLRRTSILIVLIGLMVYFFKSGQLKLRSMFVGLFFLAISYGVFILMSDVFEKQLDARERITVADSYENEGRFIEFFSFFDFYSNHMTATQQLVGYELFESSIIGRKYFGFNRSLHGDYLNFFFSTGIIGIIMLFILLFLIFKRHSFLLSKVVNMRYDKEINSLFFAFFLILLFVMIPGRLIGNFTYSGILFLFLGGTSNLLRN